MSGSHYALEPMPMIGPASKVQGAADAIASLQAGAVVVYVAREDVEQVRAWVRKEDAERVRNGAVD